MLFRSVKVISFTTTSVLSKDEFVAQTLDHTAEQTYALILEYRQKAAELNELQQMAMDVYHTKMAEEKEAKAEKEAMRQAKKAAAKAKLEAEHAASLAALEEDSDDEDASTIVISVFEAGCEEPKTPPTFDPNVFFWQAEQAKEAAQAAEAKEAAQAEAASAALIQELQAADEADYLARQVEAYQKYEQQQQQTVSDAPEPIAWQQEEILNEGKACLGDFIKTQTTENVSVQRTTRQTTFTTIATYCGKEGCHNVWQRDPEQEAWTKQQVEAAGNEWCPRKCCDKCLAAKHAQQPQAATRGKPEGDNIKTSAQKSFRR